MNGVRGVTEAVNARLRETLERLGLQVPTFLFGEDKLDIQGDAPRIVWVPRRGPADEKIKPAPDHPSMFSGDAADRTVVNPRPLWRRRLGYEVHVWGLRENPGTDPETEKDFDAAEQLAYHLIAAVHDEMWGAYAVTSEDWTKTQRSAQRRGTLVVLGLEMWLAWAREEDTYAVVTAMPITPQGA